MTLSSSRCSWLSSYLEAHSGGNCHFYKSMYSLICSKTLGEQLSARVTFQTGLTNRALVCFLPHPDTPRSLPGYTYTNPCTNLRTICCKSDGDTISCTIRILSVYTNNTIPRTNSWTNPYTIWCLHLSWALERQFFLFFGILNLVEFKIGADSYRTRNRMRTK
jgi:hypothetical protein